MTPAQALDVLNKIAAGANMNRESHDVAKMAVTVLAALLPAPTPATPAAPPSPT